MGSDSHKNTIEKLRGSENYQTWSFAIRSLLELHDLEKTIVAATARDSTPGTAQETDADKLKKAKAKIVLSMEPALYVHVQNCTSALEMWSKLKAMYEDTGLSRRIGLLRTLINATLDSSASMDEYISTIVGTANKLNGIGFTISEEWVGSFLLAGLTEQYKPFIMGIESSNVAITGDSIKARLIEMGPSSCSQSAFYGKGPKPKSRLKCEECGRPGHTIENCYELLDENPQPHGRHQAFSAFEVMVTNEKAFYGNVADRTECFLDSGASQHMVNKRSLLDNFRPAENQFVVAADNRKMAVKGIGDMTIRMDGNKFDVKRVLYIPELAANLLSVSSITNDGYQIDFHQDFCSIVAADNSPLAKGIAMCGVYKFFIEHPQQSSKVPSCHAQSVSSVRIDEEQVGDYNAKHLPLDLAQSIATNGNGILESDSSSDTVAKSTQFIRSSNVPSSHIQANSSGRTDDEQVGDNYDDNLASFSVLQEVSEGQYPNGPFNVRSVSQPSNQLNRAVESCGRVATRSDNKSKVRFSNGNPAVDTCQRTANHIDIRHCIRDAVSSSIIDIQCVSTDQMVADSFTKNVPGPEHSFCSSKMDSITT